MECNQAQKLLKWVDRRCIHFALNGSAITFYDVMYGDEKCMVILLLHPRCQLSLPVISCRDILVAHVAEGVYSSL